MALEQINPGDSGCGHLVESKLGQGRISTGQENRDPWRQPPKRPGANLDQAVGPDLDAAKRALQMFSTCTRALVESREEATLLRATVRAIVDEGDYQMAWVGVAGDCPEKKVRVLAQAGGDAGMAWIEGTDDDFGPTDVALQTGQPAVFHNFQMDPRRVPSRREAEQRGCVAALALPLKYAGRIIGGLTIHSGQSTAFQQEELELLVRLADVLAYGWHHLRFPEENRRSGPVLGAAEERWEAGLPAALTERPRTGEEPRDAQARRLEAMATLAGALAHDFNNILTIILGFGNMLQQDIRDNAAAQEDIATILQAAERARDLVRQMLSFSGREEQKWDLVQLGTAVDEALESMRASLPANLLIDWQMDPATPLVMADHGRICQATLNLTANALQAMEGMVGSLTVRLNPFRPDARFLRGHPEFLPVDYARLSVADTGHGMDAQTLERIYEPFFTTKSVGKGTGLGLSVVHGIVASHQGRITVASEPGVGTTFCLYFPVPQSAPAPAPNASPRGCLPIGFGEEILVVDDEIAITILTQRLLQRLNYEVTICNQALAALALVQDDPARFDLVITDLAMPDLTGLELVAQIRTLRPDLPVILATGLPPQISADEFRQAGIAEVLMKPVRPHTMAAALRRALSGSAA